MTLSAMFDESGKWNDSEHVVFAGFVGRQDKWAEFTHDWNMRLRSDLPLEGRDNPVLHMVELNRAHKKADDAAKAKLELLMPSGQTRRKGIRTPSITRSRLG
jgi:hypothetical protein